MAAAFHLLNKATRFSFSGARLCEPQQVRIVQGAQLNPNVTRLPKLLRVIDPRSIQTKRLPRLEKNCRFE